MKTCSSSPDVYVKPLHTHVPHQTAVVLAARATKLVNLRAGTQLAPCCIHLNTHKQNLTIIAMMCAWEFWYDTRQMSLAVMYNTN